MPKFVPAHSGIFGRAQSVHESNLALQAERDRLTEMFAQAPGFMAGLRVLQSDARIDLLLMDVGLPGGLNGRQVADAARVARPDLKVLFITGYAEKAVLGRAHLEPGMHVLTKPFALDALANRMQELIAGG